MMSINAYFDGKVIVPDGPVDLPMNQPIVVHVESQVESGNRVGWTDAKNCRRCELVDKDIAGALTSNERVELDALQAEMLSYRRSVAPLPLDDLRRLHQELVQRAEKPAQ